MNQLTVRCSCGRVMGVDTLAGRGGYRCGCGNRVQVEMAPHLPETCVAVEAESRCRLQPVTGGPILLCEAHAHAFVVQMGAYARGARALSKESESVVYYLQFGQRVKIGTTINLAQRLGAIPHDRVLGVEVGGPIMEARRHHQFAAFRIKGEWFEAAPELLAHAECLEPCVFPRRVA